MKTFALSDRPDLIAFLSAEYVATLAVPISQNGTVHAAALLYAHAESPLAFYFVTARDSEKCRLLTTRAEIPAACVVGTVKDLPFTLQMRGTLAATRLTAAIEAAYYQKRGNRHDDISDPANIALVFTPHWARGTDYRQAYTQFSLDLS